jgi:hypothetical protein
MRAADWKEEGSKRKNTGSDPMCLYTHLLLSALPFLWPGRYFSVRVDCETIQLPSCDLSPLYPQSVDCV